MSTFINNDGLPISIAGCEKLGYFISQTQIRRIGAEPHEFHLFDRKPGKPFPTHMDNWQLSIQAGNAIGWHPTEDSVR